MKYKKKIEVKHRVFNAKSHTNALQLRININFIIDLKPMA